MKFFTEGKNHPLPLMLAPTRTPTWQHTRTPTRTRTWPHTRTHTLMNMKQRLPLKALTIIAWTKSLTLNREKNPTPAKSQIIIISTKWKVRQQLQKLLLNFYLGPSQG